MPPRDRIFLAFATLVCLTFVATLRDSGPKHLVARQIELPPVPTNITERPGHVIVTAEDEGGEPIGNASVRVLLVQDERAYLAGAAHTDASGRADLRSLPKGEGWILVEGEGLARASTRLVLDEGEREVKVRLRRSSTLRVSIVDDAGAAIADAWVEARTGDPLPYVTRSDTAGRAAIARLGPAPWSLRVKATGYEMVAQTVNKAPADALKVTLRKLGFLDVATVDIEGRPIERAIVWVAGSGLWPARKVETGADGRAKVGDLPRGLYDLRATRGDLVSPAEMGVALGRGDSKSLTLVLGRGRRVAVRVTDGDEEGARPVAAASLVLAEGGVSSFPLEAMSDAQGSATLGPIAPGDAYLSARAEGFVAKTGVAVPPGATPTVRIGLVRGATLRGDVVDARGFPVDGATIEVVGTTTAGEPIDESPERMAFRATHFSWALAGPQTLVSAGELGVLPGPLPSIPHAGALPATLLRAHGSAPPPEPWVTRGDGSFRAFPVPPGRVRAIVRHPSYIEGISDVITMNAGAEAHVRVTLRGGGSLEGRIVDERRAPVAGVRVDIAATKGALERTTQTAEDGTFAFASVPGDVVLSAARPDAVDDVALRTTLSIRDGERKEVELVLPAPREPMRVAIADERGAPVDGAQVAVQSLAPETPLRRTLFTDRYGIVVFKDALGLPLRISVAKRGRAAEVRELDSAPAELRIELRGGVTVSGVVTTRRGRDRLDGAEVALYTGAGVVRARTDQDGAYKLEDVAPGSARLVATHAGYSKSEQSVEIESAPRGDRPVSLEPLNLEEGTSLEGEVVDEHGDPVFGARVARGSVPAYMPAGRPPAGVVLTDRHGAFKLDDLPEGEIAVEAYAPDVGRGRLAVRVSAGRPTRGVRISLSGANSDATLDSTASGGIAISLDEKGKGSEGVTVVGVADGSEAERAGLQPGDQILAIDGQAVHSSADARSRLFGPVGDDVVLEILRGEAKQRLRVARERAHR